MAGTRRSGAGARQASSGESSFERTSDQLIFALADDLTGALECGAKFSACGFRCLVSTSPRISEALDATVLVIDTETRHVSAQTAHTIVLECLRNAGQLAPRLIYKKTDSTLRGNIGAELRALADVFPERVLVYAPAYPDMGRTVCGGVLAVWGVPVHQTAFAQDPLNPILQSDIRVLLGDLRVHLLDGQTNDDVVAAARHVLSQEPPAIAAGPAALAGALAHCLSAKPGHTPAFPHISRCLVVNGSRHPASTAQLMEGLRSGLGGWRILDCASDAEGLERAAHTGQQVRQLLEREYYDGLVVFGGDTAFAIHRALGGQPFVPIGEIFPGVPVARSAGLTWVTKAGGFGLPDLLCQLRERMA